VQIGKNLQNDLKLDNAMKNILRITLTALGLCSGCSKNPVISPEQFTEEVAIALRTSISGAKVETVKVLELRVTCSDGNEFTSLLYNPYDLYKQQPEHKADVVQRIIAAALGIAKGSSGVADPNCIVPVIKPRAWMEEGRQAMINRGAKDVSTPLYEEFTSDLIILYAYDLPQGMRFVMSDDLKNSKIEQKDLRPLACKNLKQVIPKIERHGENGFYMLTAGGNYESSLLLLDSIWSSGQMQVQGEIVVVIPARDVLLVTGSQDQEGLARIKKAATELYNKGPYSITPKLFVYRNGVFQEF
jgi:uncharacterized protein YtpQ (UPF0354 family)